MTFTSCSTSFKYPNEYTYSFNVEVSMFSHLNNVFIVT